MPYPIEEKLVIVVSSSALFALDEADHIFRTQGVKAYREFQVLAVFIQLGCLMHYPGEDFRLGKH